MLLGLLIYGYSAGVPSSRKIERATYDSVAFRYIAANTHPDNDTLATFRRRFGEQLGKLFVQVLALAREMGMLKPGKISVDGRPSGKDQINLTDEESLVRLAAGKDFIALGKFDRILIAPRVTNRCVNSCF